jgi:hypothetical protein
VIASGEQREDCRGWWAAVLADGRSGQGWDQITASTPLCLLGLIRADEITATCASPKSSGSRLVLELHDVDIQARLCCSGVVNGCRR